MHLAYTVAYRCLLITVWVRKSWSSYQLCYVCSKTDEDGDIYMSVMQLRDDTDALQSEVEHRQKTGDLSGAKQIQQQLKMKQQQLLEKNKIRYDGHCFVITY